MIDSINLFLREKISHVLHFFSNRGNRERIKNQRLKKQDLIGVLNWGVLPDSRLVGLFQDEQSQPTVYTREDVDLIQNAS